MYKHRCICCGEFFESPRVYAQYCSDECRNEMTKSLYKVDSKSRKQPDRLTAEAVESNRLGLSYGKYMALKHSGRLYE